MISFAPSPPGFCCQMVGAEVKGSQVPLVKPEAAKEEKKEEVAAVVVEAGEPPLKYKTWVLRVSIHCEGCKRKMKKILHSIEGVYTTEIDLRQQKVTVNGDVEAETLIKRLKKMGRHAELWPLKDNKQQESGGEEPENAAGVEGDCGKGDGKNLEDAKKGPDAGALPVKNSVAVQIKAVNGEVKHMVPVPTGYQMAVFEGEGGADKTGGGSGSGKKKKKKKKKSNQGGGNNNNTDEEGPPPNERDHAYDAPPGAMLPSFVLGHGGTSHPANTGTPCHHPYQFPPQSYYAEPTPVYTVSCHTSHPCSSYGTSHYYSPQPHSHAYEYVHPFSSEMEHMPSDIEMCSSPAAETFDVLSDENPHACLVM